MPTPSPFRPAQQQGRRRRDRARRSRSPSRISARTKSPFSRSSMQVDRRWRALFPAAQLAQIHRLAEPARRFADQQDRLACALEGERGRLGEIVDEPDAADRRRRQNRAAVGLVVERHVAGHDWKVENLAGFRDAADAADELAHDLRPLRIAEIEIVGDRERPARRPRSDCASIPPPPACRPRTDRPRNSAASRRW